MHAAPQYKPYRTVWRNLTPRPTLEPFDPDPDRPDPTRSGHGGYVPAFTVVTGDFGLSTIPLQTFQDTSRRWVRSPAAGHSKRTQWKSAIRATLAILVDSRGPQSQWIRDPVDGIPVVRDPQWSPQSRDPSESAIPVKSAIPGSAKSATPVVNSAIPVGPRIRD